MASILIWFLGPAVAKVRGQDTNFLDDLGIHPYTTQLPVQNGYIDVATGRLHLEVPLASVSQRGGSQFHEKCPVYY